MFLKAAESHQVPINSLPAALTAVRLIINAHMRLNMVNGFCSDDLFTGTCRADTKEVKECKCFRTVEGEIKEL